MTVVPYQGMLSWTNLVNTEYNGIYQVQYDVFTVKYENMRRQLVFCQKIVSEMRGTQAFGLLTCGHMSGLNQCQLSKMFNNSKLNNQFSISTILLKLHHSSGLLYWCAYNHYNKITGVVTPARGYFRLSVEGAESVLSPSSKGMDEVTFRQVLPPRRIQSLALLV